MDKSTKIKCLESYCKMHEICKNCIFNNAKFDDSCIFNALSIFDIDNRFDYLIDKCDLNEVFNQIAEYTALYATINGERRQRNFIIKR